MKNNISISIKDEILYNIEKDKGLANRSKFIQKLLELGYKTYNQEKNFS